MSEEELQEQIIQQIEVLVEELGGTMCHLIKCTYTGRQSKILQIEYNVEEKIIEKIMESMGKSTWRKVW